MAEEKKDTFPWIQLIATVGTIIAALIGITPYILKLNQPSVPQTPTIVIVTLPPAVTTSAPATTLPPVTTVETIPVTTQATVVATTGPPQAGNETPAPTMETTVAMTPAGTTVPTAPPTTVPATLPPGPPIQVSVNTTSVPRGGAILASVSTDTGIPQVIITLRNSTTFESQPITQSLVQGMVELSLDTSPYAPGDYTIFAAIPDTTAEASASFVIT